MVDGLTLKPCVDCREPEASQVFHGDLDGLDGSDDLDANAAYAADVSQLADRSWSRPCGERDLGLVQNLPGFVRHVEAA